MVRTQRNATVALTATEALTISEAKFQDGAERVTLVITNLEAAGGDVAFVSVGQEAAANTGIYLAPGQSCFFSKDSGYTPSQDRVTAYSAGAISLAVYEEMDN